MNNKTLMILFLTIIGIIIFYENPYYVNAENLKEMFSTKIYDDFYIKKLHSDGSGKYKKMGKITRNSDGHFVYCVQPWVDLVEENEYDINLSNQHEILGVSSDIWKRISLIAYYGYGYQNHTDERWYGITQLMIWQTVDPTGNFFFTKTLNGVKDNTYDWMKNEIENLIGNHYVIPKFDTKNITLNIGDTISLQDYNNVLDMYEIEKDNNNADISISNNTLIITGIQNGIVEVNLKKNYNSIFLDTTSILYNRVNAQSIISRGRPDPVTIKLKINVVGGKVSVEKNDSKTLLPIPRGDGIFKDATYGIYNSSNIRVGQVIIQENSIGISDVYLKVDSYYLLEEKNSLGYQLDPTKYYFQITSDNLNPTVKVYETAIEREIEFFKVFADANTTVLKAEPNITFEFYLKSNMKLYETATTDTKGRLSVILPYGTYIVKQINTTPNYEKVKDFEIVIDNSSSDPITKIISNAEITAKPKIIKVDSESKKVIVRDGIKFRIKNLDNNEYVCQTITYPSQEKICVFETSGGAIVTPYALSLGNYQIEEVENQTIEGYVLNPIPLKFSIAQDSQFTYDEEFGTILEVQFENKQVKGEFELNKVGEDFKIENNKFVYFEKPLDGIEFDLYANDDIYSQDGTLIYKDKELVKSFKTENGKYLIKDLYLGKYCLYEKSTDVNHVISSEPYCFELKYVDQYTETVKLSKTLKNYLKKGNLNFNKLDSSTSEAIPNTTIEIYMESKDSDTLIGEYITDINGGVIIKNIPIIENTRFYILEKNPAEGYIMNEEKNYFSFNENNENIKVTMFNDKIKSIVKILKVDEEGNPLAGVKIGIYDLDNNEIGIYITNEFGEIVEELKYNDYMYKELETLEGFILDNSEHYFSINTNNEIIELELVNHLMKIEIPNTSSNSYFIVLPVSVIIGSTVLLIILKRKKNKRV